MMALRNFIRHWLCLGFWRREEGAVLAEALLTIPFVTLFAAGILEFGSIFWQRMQIDAGLRDAGRYLSRCRPVSGTYVPTCNQATAKTIAFYGTQTPAADAEPRVPDWKDYVTGEDPLIVTFGVVSWREQEETSEERRFREREIATWGQFSASARFVPAQTEYEAPGEWPQWR